MLVIRYKTLLYFAASIFLVVAIFILGVSSAGALTDNCFTDVTTGMWFHDYVCWMFDEGLTVGYPDGTYRPAEYVNRAQMAVFLQQMSGEGSIGPIVDADKLDGLDSVDFSPAAGVPKSCQWRVVKESGDTTTLAACTDIGVSYYAVSGGCYSTSDTLKTCFPTKDGLRYGNGATTATYAETERADGWYGRWQGDVAVHEVAVLCCNW